MTYFKISTGKFVQYDEATNKAIIVVKTDLQTQKSDLEARIAQADPNMPKTNAEWITWAKANYKYVDHSMEVAELNRINGILDGIKLI